MYMPPNTCTVCWKGQYVNGVCTSCHHKATPPSQRRIDALPVRTNLKNRYVIGEVLGNGGFGITYSAWDSVQNKRVAVKELYPRNDVYRAEDDLTIQIRDGQEEYVEKLRSCFENEAELLMSLNKECEVVEVYELFRANGTVYYSMEFLDGCDMKTYLYQKGPVPWSFLEPRLIQVLKTLDALHSRNLIHRDISPDNLFLTKDEKLRLIDFGSVRTYQGATGFTVFLKQHFAPVEQYRSNGKQGPYTDLYALSVSVYMLLTGKLPPKAPDRLSGTQVIPLKQLCPQIPDQAVRAIEKGMSLLAKDRFQTAAEYLQALPGGGPTTITPTPPPPPNPQNLVYWLAGREGRYKGIRRKLNKNVEIRFGREEKQNGTHPKEVPFPSGYPGVSRNQCSVFINTAGDIFAKDNHSSYGTFLNGKPLGENWTKVSPGSYLRFASEAFQLYCTDG